MGLDIKKSGFQSFDRGLEVIRLLAENKRMTASKIAESIGIHQTSATRMLQSLKKAKLVYKPDFHSFALDLGILRLGGMAMRSFPIVRASGAVCDAIRNETGLDAAVGTLVDGQLLYFAKIDRGASFSFVDDSNYPPHLSSIGLLLIHSKGKREALRVIRGSLNASGGGALDERGIYEIVEADVSALGFLCLRDYAGNTVNCSKMFMYERGEAALRGFKVVAPVDGMSSNEAFTEAYTAWHLVNAARIMNAVTLTRVGMISF